MCHFGNFHQRVLLLLLLLAYHVVWFVWFALFPVLGNQMPKGHISPMPQIAEKFHFSLPQTRGQGRRKGASSSRHLKPGCKRSLITQSHQQNWKDPQSQVVFLIP